MPTADLLRAYVQRARPAAGGEEQALSIGTLMVAAGSGDRTRAQAARTLRRALDALVHEAELAGFSPDLTPLDLEALIVLRWPVSPPTAP